MEHLDRRKKITIMAAIMVAVLFSSLNQNIVGTVLPKIVSEIGGMEYFNWVFTVYMLTSSVSAILAGKLSDIYGRRPLILIGIGIFLIGTFLNGLSQTMMELILHRALQGIGGGMILSSCFSVVGDLYSPRERGRWQGLMSTSFAVAGVFGPTLGGWIVDHVRWHWVFWVFLPFGLVAFTLIWTLLPSVQKRKGETIDYWGSILLMLTIVPLLLAFSWGGNKFAWNSFAIIGLLGVSVCALIAFIQVERFVRNPVLPITLFRNRVFTISNLSGFTMGAGVFGATMFLPFFVQGVMGKTATESGYVTMPFMICNVLANNLSGQWMSRTGKYKKLVVSGMLIMAGGMGMLSLMNFQTPAWVLVLDLCIVGIGFGIGMPIFSVATQNAVDQRMLGVATASTQLFRQMGGTFGVSIMGTVLINRMQDELTKHETPLNSALDPTKLPPDVVENLASLKDPQMLMDTEKLNQTQAALPPDVLPAFESLVQILREVLSGALSSVFMTGAIIVSTTVVMCLFLKEIPLRTSNRSLSRNESADRIDMKPTVGKS